MARPRTPLSSYGRITVDPVEYVVSNDGGRRRLTVRKDLDQNALKKHELFRARARYRFPSGKLAQVERFAASRAKAEAALKRALAEIQESSTAEVKRETRVKDLGERFLLEKAGRAPRTIEGYTHIVRKVIAPRIGDLAVAEVTSDRLQRVLDDVAATHGIGQARNTRAVLSGMMGIASRSDVLKTNPVQALARVEGKPRGSQAIPLAELPELLDAVRGDERLRRADMVDLVEFLAGTGVRISEAIGLDWADVEITAPTGIPSIGATVTVRKSKTDAGVRRIAVPAGVGASLARRERRDGPVFPTPLLKRRDRRNTAGEWSAARERLGLDNYTFHSFRKTVATALDQAGLSARDIAEYLGHENPSLTMNVYMSKTVGGGAAAIALDSYMSPRG